MSVADTDSVDCPLSAIADTAEQPVDALWLLLAAPLEPRAFNSALAEYVASSGTVSVLRSGEAQ